MCFLSFLLHLFCFFFFFFFNDTATTEIYTLSLHDALPICGGSDRRYSCQSPAAGRWPSRATPAGASPRSAGGAPAAVPGVGGPIPGPSTEAGGVAPARPPCRRVAPPAPGGGPH